MEDKKTKLEQELEQLLDQHDILILDDFLSDDEFEVPKPLLQEKNEIPEFNEELYLKKFGKDFSFLLLDSLAKKHFLNEKYEEDVRKIKSENKLIEAENEKTIQTWVKEKLDFYKEKEEKNVMLKTLYTAYSEGKAQAVLWFFNKVLLNIPHAIFHQKNIVLSFDEQERQLKLKFVFPDKKTVFNQQDRFPQITSINSKHFQEYYLSVLFLLFKILYTKIMKNDIERTVNTILFEGYVIEDERSTSDLATKKLFSILSPVTLDVLRKLEKYDVRNLVYQNHLDLVKEFSLFQNKSIEELTKSDELQNYIEAKLFSHIDSQLQSLKEEIIQYVDTKVRSMQISINAKFLSSNNNGPEKIKEVHVDDVNNKDESIQTQESVNEPTPLNVSGESSELSIEEQFEELISKINNMSIHHKSTFFNLIKEPPLEKLKIDELNIEKLKLMRIMNALIYMDTPLIKISGSSSEYVIWGEDYPSELVDFIIKKYA
ncbi:MAG TPA: hypothetical protein PLI77_08525 [Bacteroidales bacterium]|nr:hypothetical protein [Bacteroidales bacterium]HRW35508.1 hypothetical protein [Thermotogota bacterium]